MLKYLPWIIERNGRLDKFERIYTNDAAIFIHKRKV